MTALPSISDSRHAHTVDLDQCVAQRVAIERVAHAAVIETSGGGYGRAESIILGRILLQALFRLEQIVRTERLAHLRETKKL